MSRLTNKDLIFEGGRSSCKTLFDKVYRKLGKLEDIETELGIDLEFLINKVLKEGIVDDIGREYYGREISIGYQMYRGKFTLVLKYFDDFDCCRCVMNGLNYIPQTWLLADYQKTWWLIEDLEDEEDD